MNADTIEIRRLRVATHIGVPEAERATPQNLLITVKMVSQGGFDNLGDAISETIDYHAVSLEIEALAAARPRKLIETLAVEIADDLLARYPLQRVTVSIEKHILPATECVAVHVERISRSA